MDFRNAVQFIGDYHHVEVSPSAHLDFGTDITFRSFTSLEVGNDAKLKLGDRVFLMSIVQFVVVKKLRLGKIPCLVMEYGFLITIINTPITILKKFNSALLR